MLAFPTETFYGLGCCADQPVHMPLPLLAGSLELLRPYVTLEQAPEALLTAFWPGPLTVVLTARLTPLEGRRPLAPQLVNSRGKAAVRLTPHPLAARLSCLAGAPLTASSANISGQAAARVPDELDERLLAALTGPDDGVVSGPAPAGGVPSTIVEPLAGTDLRVLRLGAVSLEALRAAGFTPHLA